MIKDVRVLVEDGEIREDSRGKTLHVAPEFDPGIEASIQEWFEQYYSVGFRNYPVSDDYVPEPERIDCD